jgi:hypothetical protein
MATAKDSKAPRKPPSLAKGRTRPPAATIAANDSAAADPPYLALHREHAEDLARLSHDLGMMWSAVPSLAYAMLESVDAEEGADAAYVALKYLSELASYKADAITGTLGFGSLKCSRHFDALKLYAGREHNGGAHK